MTITALPTDAQDAPLRRALRIDGACSTAAGVAVLAAVGPVSSATGNAVFTVAAIAAAAVASPPLTPTGVLLMLGAGVYTAVIGAVQYRGARRMSALDS